MNEFIIPLSEVSGENRNIAGNKAASLASSMQQGMRVPGGACITRQAYEIFIRETGIGQKILLELGRKLFEDMRWEELWDASLRIRKMFTTAGMPQDVEWSIKGNTLYVL